jgi:RNA polymerase sigma-70 factor (ECF subfamily)
MSVMERDMLDSVVTRAATGDGAAFARIVAAHHDDMARVCFAICRDVDLAQEAVHAAWPIAWRKLSSIRDPGQLRPWLITIAVNEARGLARRRGRRVLREITVETLPPGLTGSEIGDPSRRVDSIDLANALMRLDLDDRALLGMRYGAGLSAVEIGRVLGITDRGVRARLARVLRRLREDLGDE